MISPRARSTITTPSTRSHDAIDAPSSPHVPLVCNTCPYPNPAVSFFFFDFFFFVRRAARFSAGPSSIDCGGALGFWPAAIFCIIVRICWNSLTKRRDASASRPAPRAIRRCRDLWKLTSVSGT